MKEPSCETCRWNYKSTNVMFPINIVCRECVKGSNWEDVEG